MARWLVVVVLVAGCTGGGARSVPKGVPAAPGDFPDNPQLVHIPADTPYAFATFKPISPEYLRKLQPLMASSWAKMSRGGNGSRWAGVAEEIGGMDPQHLEQAGMSLRARMVIYGLGGYPVMRVEISDRDRLQAVFERVARRWGKPLPPASERAGMRYWIIDTGPGAYLLGLGAGEAVLAVAPRDRLVAQLGLILGDVAPPRALTTAWFRDYARREGFTGQGVGFVDLQRVEALAVGAVPSATPACRAAVDDLARSVPRIGFGYDDLTAKRMSFGVIVELAPELLAAVRTLTTKLSGLTRLGTVRPVFAAAGGIDLERARGFIPQIAARLRDLGERCETSLDGPATRLEELGRRVLSSPLGGLRGAVIALTRLERSPAGTGTMIEGFGVLHVEDPSTLLGMAAAIPDFVAPELDGKAAPLPALLKVPGHIAVRPDAIAVALGADSQRAAEEVLAEPPVPAPLFMMLFDYARLGEGSPLFSSSGTDGEMMKAMSRAVGLTTIAVDVDERGLVGTMAMELR